MEPDLPRLKFSQEHGEEETQFARKLFSYLLEKMKFRLNRFIKNFEIQLKRIKTRITNTVNAIHVSIN